MIKYETIMYFFRRIVLLISVYDLHIALFTFLIREIGRRKIKCPPC